MLVLHVVLHIVVLCIAMTMGWHYGTRIHSFPNDKNTASSAISLSFDLQTVHSMADSWLQRSVPGSSHPQQQSSYSCGTSKQHDTLPPRWLLPPSPHTESAAAAKDPKTASYYWDLPPSLSNFFVGGIARVNRNDFVKIFGGGIPTPPVYKDEDALLIYDSERSMPARQQQQQQQQRRRSLDHSESLVEATEHCQLMRVVTVPVNPVPAEDVCTVIHAVKAEPHFFIHNWVQEEQRQHDGSLRYRAVSRYHPSSTLKSSTDQYKRRINMSEPPKPVSVREANAYLQAFLSIQTNVLQALTPLVQQVAIEKPKTTTTTASTTTTSSRTSWITHRIVVVMTCNWSHAELLHNYVCAAKAIGMDQGQLARILIVSIDAQTHTLAQSLGLTSFYYPGLFALDETTTTTSSTAYGTREYGRIMMAKVVSVYLINQLGYDVFFQDVGTWFLVVKLFKNQMFLVAAFSSCTVFI